MIQADDVSEVGSANYMQVNKSSIPFAREHVGTKVVLSANYRAGEIEAAPAEDFVLRKKDGIRNRDLI